MRLPQFVSEISKGPPDDRFFLNGKFQAVLDTICARDFAPTETDGPLLSLALDMPAGIATTQFSNKAYDSFYTALLYRVWLAAGREDCVTRVPLAAALNFAVQTLSMRRQEVSLSQSYLQVGGCGGFEFLAAAANSYAIRGALHAAEDEMVLSRDRMANILGRMRVVDFAWAAEPVPATEPDGQPLVGVLAVCNRSGADAARLLRDLRPRLTRDSAIVVAGEATDVEAAVDAVREAGPVGSSGTVVLDGFSITAIEDHHLHSGV